MAYQGRKTDSTTKKIGAGILITLGVIWLLGGALLGAVLEGFFPVGILWMVFSLATLIFGIHCLRHADAPAKEQQKGPSSNVPDDAVIERQKKTAAVSTRPPTISAYKPKPSPIEEPPVKLPEILILRENPYAAVLEYIGPDGLQDESGISCWLAIQAEADIHDVIREAVGWVADITRSAPLQPGQHTSHAADRLTRWTYQKYIEQKKIILTENPHLLKDVSEEEKQQCASVNITFALMDGGKLYDLMTGKRARLVTQEWPGTVDDAATYGSWSLSWS